MDLTKQHLNTHKNYLKELLSVSKSRGRTRAFLEKSKLGQLRVILRLIVAVGVGQIAVTNKLHAKYIARHVKNVRKIIHHISNFLKRNRETLLPILMGMVSILRYIVLPLFSPEGQGSLDEAIADGEEQGDFPGEGIGEDNGNTGLEEEEEFRRKDNFGEGCSGLKTSQ